MTQEARRVMVVYGTRPEAIKVAPVIAELAKSRVLDPVVTVTGQHREMLDQVNDLFAIEPRYDLDLMVPGATLGEMASRALAATTAIMEKDRPDAVLVQGDTSTAFIAALAAFYLQIPVVHLEAGLRTGNMSSPFPEEGNRRLTAPIAALHLAPTATSRANLLREGVHDADIVTTGNTVIDALQTAVSMPAEFTNSSLERLIRERERFVLVTTHRRESWGAPMRSAMCGLRAAAERFPELSFVLPMHRNPVVREILVEVLGGAPNVLLIEPLTYHEFAHSMEAAYICLTDSGGVQEEAPSLGKPVLVMRDTTERPEAVEAGTVRLVGTEASDVFKSLSALLEDSTQYESMANAVNPYGDGRAAMRSVAAIQALFELGERLPDFAPNGEGDINV